MRLLIAYATQKDLIYHLDFNSAFLHWHILEKVYLTQPAGFFSKIEPDKVCRINKAIYDLKQGSKAWNTKLDVFTNQEDNYIKVKNRLAKNFPIKDLGLAPRIFGINLPRDLKNGKTYLDQTPYIESILACFHMPSCSSSPTPIPLGFNI